MYLTVFAVLPASSAPLEGADSIHLVLGCTTPSRHATKGFIPGGPNHVHLIADLAFLG